MAATQTDEGAAQLCMKAQRGSSWNALMLCIRAKPSTFDGLLAIVTTGHSKRASVIAFDACADAWTVYSDARKVGDL
jgi:hypothetical protein